MEAVNSCRFCGKITDFTVSVVGDSKLTLGKGTIFLPDPNNSRIGQSIKITAWEEIARRIEELEEGTWIMVLSSYMPSTFRGSLQDTFNVTSLVVYE